MGPVEVISRAGRPAYGFGVGQTALVAPAAATAASPSPITVALAGGAATAATGWLLEKAWETMRGRRR